MIYRVEFKPDGSAQGGTVKSYSVVDKIVGEGKTSTDGIKDGLASVGWRWINNPWYVDPIIYFDIDHKHFDNIPSSAIYSKIFADHLKYIKLGKFIDKLD